MRKLILFLAVNICFTAALALTPVHTLQTPPTLFYGSLTVTTDASGPWECRIDSTTTLTVTPWGGNHGAGDWETITEYTLWKLTPDGKRQCLAREKAEDYPAFTGIKIYQAYTGLRITCARGKRLFMDSGITLRPLDTCATMEIRAKSHKRKFRITDNFTPYPTVACLNEPLPANETNPAKITGDDHCGRWRYLDSTLPGDKHVTKGGKYVLDIVNDPDIPGNMFVIYHSGAERDSIFWKPGQVKAVLIPTSFPGHYDLTWYDSRRYPVTPGECSATFQGINLLTMDFHQSGAQLRFERVLDVR